MRHYYVVVSIFSLLFLLCGTVQAQDAEEYTSLEQLKDKQIGVITGMITDQSAIDYWGQSIDLNYYKNQTDMIAALYAGKVDAIIVDEPVALEIVNRNKGLAFIKEKIKDDSYGFAFAKTEKGLALRDEFNSFLKTANDGHLLQDMGTIWLGTDKSVQTIEPVESLSSENGKIRFATCLTVPPFGYIDNGKAVGFEVDLITRFCKAYGYGLELSDVDFNGLITGIVSGHYDAAASCMSITEERSQSVYFSDPTYIGGIVAVVLSGDSAEAAASNQIPNQETAKYAILVGSTSEKLVEERFPNATLLPFDSLSDAVLGLLTGKADYVVSAYSNCLNFIRSNPGKLTILPGQLSPESVAIVINKSETQLTEDITRIIEKYKADGTLDRLISNWIREDDSAYIQDEIPVLADAPILATAVSAEREPMCFIEDGKVVGLDAELIQRVAYELGMRVKFYDMKFSQKGFFIRFFVEYSDRDNLINLQVSYPGEKFDPISIDSDNLSVMLVKGITKSLSYGYESDENLIRCKLK